MSGFYRIFVPDEAFSRRRKSIEVWGKKAVKDGRYVYVNTPWFAPTLYSHPGKNQEAISAAFAKAACRGYLPCFAALNMGRRAELIYSTFSENPKIIQKELKILSIQTLYMEI